MDFWNDKLEPQEPRQKVLGQVSAPDNQSPVADLHTQTKVQTGKAIELPTVQEILSESTVSSPAAPARDGQQLQSEEQEDMFRSLEAIFREADANEGNFQVKELLASLDEADAGAKRGQRNLQALEGVRAILDRLWYSRSDYMARAAELLANGSRDQSWRAPYGRAGILDFFLRVVASKDDIDNDILLHSLRLIGNSCADTDENRQLIVDANYTLPIIRFFLDPELVHVAIPVIYNICADFEPAQSQVATNRIAYILLKLIRDGSIEGNALLNYAYELVEMAAEQAQGIDASPDGTVLLLMDLAVDEHTTFTQYACLVNCLVTYLQNERFQNVCLSNGMVEKLLAVLRRSYSTDADESSSEDVQLLAQLRLKINQALSDVSALPQFMEVYPLDSSLSKTLKSWLESPEDQMQICACVMLGNLARSDEVCQVMVQSLEIHKALISILKSEARGAVLHAALGFLKNLAIAGDNKSYLGDADIIPAISHLWGFDTVPQVQFAAASLARQVISSSVKNISRLLERLSPDPDSPAHMRTYLSLLLSLFRKTDSTPIKTEIGRAIASICRMINSRTREESNETNILFERLFSLHEDVARPIGAMITQTQWLVVRSEGLFALALMATTKQGSLAVVDCLENMDVYQVLQSSLSADISESTDDNERLRRSKDRDNTIILVKELLKHDPETLPQTKKAMLEDLMKNTGRPALAPSS